jgi:hypothetical protein
MKQSKRRDSNPGIKQYLTLDGFLVYVFTEAQERFYWLQQDHESQKRFFSVAVQDNMSARDHCHQYNHYPYHRYQHLTINITIAITTK